MRKHLGYFVFAAILVAYSIVQTTSYYKAQKSQRAALQSELEYNLKSLENHPLDLSLAEYDKKYGTTLSSYNLTQPEMAAYAHVIYPRPDNDTLLLMSVSYSSPSIMV